ncbi:MAG: hypothetical protein AB7P03_18055 [Kofleriaceae bacterium]
MRARGILIVLACSKVAAAEPRPQPVDIKPIKNDLIVLQDAQGGTYVVYRVKDQDKRVFFGTAKKLHEQIVIGGSADGDAWGINIWTPRLANIRSGEIELKKDGTYFRSCDGKADGALTRITGTKAAGVLDKAAFLTSAMVYRPYLLARDDAGVYYYVDRLSKLHGGKGYRVFVGKKGGMKRLALTDIATDTAGDVFSTRSGNLRLVDTNGTSSTTWIKGERKTDLIKLDVDANSQLIFSDLGIYTFIGTICDAIPR